MLGPMSIGALSSGAAQAGFTGAYDAIPNLAHVYEIARRTLTSYTGDLVRLRRDSDNAEMDFGYDANGDLDTAAITTWLGGASGFVVTVYDQVGSNNITQAQAARQPLFVASGLGGRAVMSLDGSDDYLQGAFSAAISQPFPIYAVAKLATAVVDGGGGETLLDGDDGTNRVVLWQRAGGTPDDWSLNAGATLIGGASDDNWNAWSIQLNGVSSQFWANGVSEASGDAGTNSLDALTLGINYLIQSVSAWQGDIGPVIIADAAHNTTQRQAMETAINDYYSIF